MPINVYQGRLTPQERSLNVNFLCTGTMLSISQWVLKHLLHPKPGFHVKPPLEENLCLGLITLQTKLKPNH